MHNDFLEPDDLRWADFLAEVPHDVYHLPEYVQVVAGHEGGRAIAFWAEANGHRMLIPLLRQALPPLLGAPSHWGDLSTPYGYAGPLFDRSCDRTSAIQFLQAFRDRACRDGFVSAFIRLHPLLSTLCASLDSVSGFVTQGQTVYVDLMPSREHLWAQTRKRYRTQIRRLEREAYGVRFDDWSFYDQFVSIYSETMERLQADASYNFPDEYFRNLREALGNKLHLGVVLSPSGECAAGGLFTSTCGIVQYHLGGTATKFLRNGPFKLMLDHVRWWAKDSGHRFLHLGGGVGARKDGLFTFKAGFSKLRADFYTCHVVLHPERYQRLVGLWRDRNRQSVPRPSFFPEYRSAPEAAEIVQPTRAPST